MKTSHYWYSLLLLALGLAWSLPVGAAAIKSVQSGTVTMSSNPQSVTITSVNPAKAFVVCQRQGSNMDPLRLATCELGNGTYPVPNPTTTLTITANVVETSGPVQWYVVEFSSGVTVQRGLVPTTTFTSATATVNVTLSPAVDLAETFVITSARYNVSGTYNIDEQWTTRALLTSATNLELTRLETGTALNVAWQVIQIESAKVQSGLVTITQSQTSNTATLSPAVDVTKTFLVFSSRAGTATSGHERRYQVTGELTNGTTLTFTRAYQNNTANTQVDISWFAVTMTDGTTVQRGLAGPSGTDPSHSCSPIPPSATMNAALAAIVINRSVPIISVTGDAASAAPSLDLDDSSWTAAFTSTTNLQMARTCNADLTTNATVAWFVVQFANNLIDSGGRGAGGQEIYP